ncbi:Dynein heavy chain 2, axonemal, partial [Cichlidogyrus casuarinus]
MKTDEFKRSNLHMQNDCRNIVKELMIKIEPNRIYRGNEFQDSQIDHRKRVLKELKHRHDSILNSIKDIKLIFDTLDDFSDTSKWDAYVSKIDSYCEEAFRINFRESLLIMNKALKGDGRNDPDPLFNVTVNLEDHNMIFMPTLTSLSELVANLSKEFLRIISNFPRIRDIHCSNAKTTSKMASLAEILGQDIELGEIQINMSKEMQKINKTLEVPLGNWDLYRDIWEIDKDEFIVKLRKENPPCADIDADILRYNEVANKVDYAYDFMEQCRENLSVEPETLDTLGVILKTLDDTNLKKIQLEESFVNIEEQFVILDKCEMDYSEQLIQRRANIASDWNKFRHKETFKNGLLADADEWRKKLAELLSTISKSGPTGLMAPAKALKILDGFYESLESLKEMEKRIRKGLTIFKVELGASKDIPVIERELETFKSIWLLFLDLLVADMEDQSNTIYKKISKYVRENKDQNWQFLESIKIRLERFRKTLPLIMDLKNKAMRLRHWDQYAEVLGEVSTAASKELAIEKNIANIDKQWENLEIDLLPYKDKGHFKIRSLDDATQTLEDNQVQLTTMKASRFVKPFEQLVEGWVKRLTKIGEIMDALLL